uniref:CAP domain-containing protein (inferred by orthology to a C. elegans protein) n=1 Tax=Strongyloides venezuelensis TaxID=75913 RepID=A0A0K0FJQ4_STRVS
MNSYSFIFFTIILKFFFLNSVVNSLDINTGNQSVSRLTSEEQKRILQVHNDLRSGLALGSFGLPEGSSIQEMIYDPMLESYAKNHTDNCIFELSDIEEYGENIFKTNSTDTSLNSLLLAFNIWWNQIKNVNSTVFDPNDGALNFGQMAWGNTSKVGCSASDCKTFKLVLCYYYPRGNIDKNNIYEIGSYCKNDNDCINVNNGSCVIGKGLCSLKSTNEMVNITHNSEVTLNSAKEPPENSISLGNISSDLVSTVQNGLNNATSAIKNVSTDLVSHVQYTASGLLGGAANLLGDIGQTVGNVANTLLNNTNAFINSKGNNLNDTFLGTIPGFNGSLSFLINGTGNLQQIINNITGISINTANGMGSNSLNTTSNIDKLLNTTTPSTNTLLDETVGNSSGTIVPIINGTINFPSTTGLPSVILNGTNGIVSPLLNTTIVEGLLNTTSNGLLLLTSLTIANETTFAGTTSIPSALNITLSTEVVNVSSSLTSPAPTMSSILTTTCEWGIICNPSIPVTNQILANMITTPPDTSNITSVAGSSNCQDLKESCNIMVLFCSFSMYQPFMFSTCPKTCQQC